MLDIIQSTATLISPAFNQSFNQLLSDAIQLALLGLVALLSYAVKIGISHLKYSWQRKLAFKLVSFAEKRILTNDARLAYVRNALKSNLPRLKPEEIEQLVEQAVIELRSNLTTESK